jgi:hypothetical protein
MIMIQNLIEEPIYSYSDSCGIAIEAGNASLMHLINFFQAGQEP